MAQRHSSQDTSHLILHCPPTDSLRHSLFGDSLSLYDLWSRPWGVARLLGLHGLPPCPHPSEGVGQTTTTTTTEKTWKGLELRRETKSIGSNGKYFRAVATPNREKSKEEEEEVDSRPTNSSDVILMEVLLDNVAQKY